MVKYFQSSLNSKFAMSLQYPRKVRDKVELLHENKYQSFLQVACNTLAIKVSYKVILLLFMSMIKHSQSTENNRFSHKAF